MIPYLEWFATIGGIVAAFMISLDFGRRVTGWGFVLFAFASLAWVGYGLMDEEGGLLTQNIVLFGINLLGIYRYLIRKRPVEAGAWGCFGRHCERSEAIQCGGWIAASLCSSQ